MTRPGGWVDPQHLMPKPDYAYEIDTPFETHGLREQVLRGLDDQEEEEMMSDPMTVLRPYLDKVGEAADASMAASRVSDSMAADEALINAYGDALEKAMELLGIAEGEWLDTNELREGDTISRIHYTGLTWRFKVRKRDVTYEELEEATKRLTHSGPITPEKLQAWQEIADRVRPEGSTEA